MAAIRTLLLTASWTLLISSTALAQTHPPDSTRTVNKRRLTGLITGATVAYGVTLYGLNELWYSQNPRQSFTFFNDNAEWKQVDKVGHFYSTFFISATVRTQHFAGLV
jgi:hypothetical protein